MATSSKRSSLPSSREGIADTEGEDSEEERLEVSKALDRCLSTFSYLRTNHAIHKFFRQYATEERNEDGRTCISPEQAVEMSPQVAAKLSLPASLFHELPTVFERFDFDADGLLDMRECTRMYRQILRQRRKELGGREIQVDVPCATVEGKGYMVERELGRGGQGVMYLCAKRGSTKPYCVKFYSKEGEKAEDLDDIIEEFATMKGLSNEHIAKTYEVFQDDSHYYLVNEPYFGGDLTKLAKRAHDQGVDMTEAWWRRIFWQCLDGLQYLHSKAIIHCDIKEANIMVAEGDSFDEPRIVLIDFGLAAPFSTTQKGASGTPGYIPPETHETGWWYPRGDVFSMGITFFQLMVGQVPRDDNSIWGVLQGSGGTETIVQMAKEVRIPWERFPGSLPLLRDLIEQMTQRDRQDRPSAPQALSHEWFASDADAELPGTTLCGLLGTSISHCARERVIEQLSEENNLQELRQLHIRFQEVDAAGEGVVPAQHAAALLHEHGASERAATAFTDAHTRADGAVGYRDVMQESLHLKERYSEHFLRDLFDELDVDGSGQLSASELQALLDTDAFECPSSDIEDLMAEMDTDSDGMVSFAEFRRALLQDGRIGRRSGEGVRRAVLQARNPCCYCS
mmetsp:Transcript_7223/g.20031  ORF Transcript_7223/g.20031 Transcript_7223/m.20031 type:complete len:625 (-) Transcript_7223:116-1990(-)